MGHISGTVLEESIDHQQCQMDCDNVLNMTYNSQYILLCDREICSSLILLIETLKISPIYLHLLLKCYVLV